MLAVSIRKESMRTRAKLFTVLLLVATGGAVVLSCYALFIQTQAEALLKDLTALTVGTSTEFDAEQLARKHSRYLVSRESSDGIAITTFNVQNKWLSALKLEPSALFGASVSVRGGHVYCVSAWLTRSMDIYPTFSASAGMVDECAEYPQYISHGIHFEFPTPVGKPYLRIRLDSHASAVQRRDAFNFSFRCLIKPGWGCDLPCDYLPSAWQDWKAYLRELGFPEDFNQRYPNNSRCRQ